MTISVVEGFCGNLLVGHSRTGRMEVVWQLVEVTNIYKVIKDFSSAN